ncbi:phosphatidylglycerol lysyltransferase domain-containing protein [Thioclava sp. GXIMD2076]|uniref:bifunctional lysylphosphatidylglycerol flippase/synthetase MprF n=1 Tax=Thioclava sp. GXIMD2076 TaxID=3131931 RepID=UPI0030CAD673
MRHYGKVTGDDAARAKAWPERPATTAREAVLPAQSPPKAEIIAETARLLDYEGAEHLADDPQQIAPRTQSLAWGKAIRRQIAAIVMLACFAWILRDRVTGLDYAAILASLGQVSAWQWLGAALATLASFAALANYDALIHKIMDTGQNEGQSKRAGWVSIAISQTVGFGLISGALVRWRMLPGFSMIEASKLTAMVAATFLAGWAVVTAMVVIVTPVQLPGLPIFALQGFALLGLLLGGAVAALALWNPVVKIGKWQPRLPSLPVMGRILWLTIADTAFAALALWVLMPPDTVHPLIALYPAFLLALGAGFISGTPGGVGPFEVTLLMLLPGAEQAPLLAAIVAWRAVYYGAPAALALAVLALGAPVRHIPPRGRLVPAAPEYTPRIAELARLSPHAEFGILRQGEHFVLLGENMRSGWMVGQTQQALVGMRDPVGETDLREMLRALRIEARAQGRLACLYKVHARTALEARRLGWSVVPVAQECWLRPDRFTLDAPAMSGLRRKLRKAAKAGLTCEHCMTQMPMAQMSEVATEWTTARGGERGFSMGRFTPDYVSEHEVVLAWFDGRLVGFASFHANDHEWALDLMRTSDDAPDGTMHQLIVTAIAAAREMGCPRLSLAALPPRPDQIEGPAAMIWRRAERGHGAAGLRQFKMGFAPHLTTLYVAAPSASALALACADIARIIRKPPALRPARDPDGSGVWTHEITDRGGEH